MDKRTIIEVEVTNLDQLKSSLGIPEDDIYVELTPGVGIFYEEPPIQRSELAPIIVTLILQITGGVAVKLAGDAMSAAIKNLVKKIDKGSGQTITVVKRHTVKITEEEETVVKIQKLLEEKEESDSD